MIKLQNVTKSFRTDEIETTALNGINLDVEEGEFVAVMGPSGCGKTTLLSLLAADNPQAYARDIQLFGRKRGSGETIWDIKRKIGFISPELHQFTPKSKKLRAILIDEMIWLYKELDREEVEKEAIIWMKWFELKEINLELNSPPDNETATHREIYLMRIEIPAFDIGCGAKYNNLNPRPR